MDTKKQVQAWTREGMTAVYETDMAVSHAYEALVFLFCQQLRNSCINDSEKQMEQ